jgi:phage terminase large subunit-like protein
LWVPEDTLWTPDNTDGLDACDLIESYVRLTKGPLAGDLMQLRMWQGDLVCDVLRLDEYGYRVYQTYLLLVSRKNSKSLLGAGFAIDGLLDEEGAEVYSAAGDKDQAKLVFAEVRKAVEASPDLDAAQGGLFKCYRDAIEYPATQSVYRALSSESFTKEGLNPSRVLFDELHAQPNWELWNVMNQGSDTREQPLVLAISTFGVKTDTTGQTSVCKAQHEYVEKILAGEVTDPRFGARIYATSKYRNKGFDYRDPRNWAPANPALGDFLRLDNMIATCRKMPEADFKTKRLNIWVHSATPWLPDGAWNGCEDRDREIPDHSRVVLSFDGSKSGDCTGITVTSVEEVPHVDVVELWEKSPQEQNWRVPRAEVKDKIREACRRWEVAEIAWDEFLWLDAAEELEEEGLPVAVFPQTMQRMGPATQRFYELAVDCAMTQSGDPRLARHIGNAILRRDSRGARISKDKADSPRKIDLAVCAVMGVDRAAWHLRNNESEPPPATASASTASGSDLWRPTERLNI